MDLIGLSKKVIAISDTLEKAQGELQALYDTVLPPINAIYLFDKFYGLNQQKLHGESVFALIHKDAKLVRSIDGSWNGSLPIVGMTDKELLQVALAREIEIVGNLDVDEAITYLDSLGGTGLVYKTTNGAIMDDAYLRVIA